ncbi:UDP-glucose 4-epimerase [Candidatus Babeliales bacterium]|nr:UDP-glucose 4-epimerase [Candidatus Babeliales bacterium]
MNSILITGGLGYCGSHIAYAVARHGYQVVLLDTKETLAYPWATIVQDDFCDKQVLHDLFTHYRITAVIHCAETHTAFPYTTNVASTLRLIESMIEHNVTQLLFKSHSSVLEEQPFSLCTQHHYPSNAYRISKDVVEQMLLELTSSHNISTIILRHDIASGALPEATLAPQSSSIGNPIPELIHAAHTQQLISLNNTHVFHDYIHIQDLADAYVKALFHLEQTNYSDIFNVGIGKNTSLQDIVACIEQITKRPVSYITTAQQCMPGRPIDASRTYDILAWKPRYSDIPFIIRSSIAYYQRYGYHTIQSNVIL